AACVCADHSRREVNTVTDKRVLDGIQTVARKCKTPAPIVEAVIRRLLPAIRLVPQREEAEASRLGGSRIGGRPDLPPAVDWPRASSSPQADCASPGLADLPLQFLMQINLAEMTPFDVRKALPTGGLLLFFYA